MLTAMRSKHVSCIHRLKNDVYVWSVVRSRGGCYWILVECEVNEVSSVALLSCVVLERTARCGKRRFLGV